MLMEPRAVRRPTLEEHSGYTIQRQDHSRWWEVRDPTGELVCLTVYRRGAREVLKRLASVQGS